MRSGILIAALTVLAAACGSPPEGAPPAPAPQSLAGEAVPFVLLDTAPEDHRFAAGQAAMDRTAGSTTVGLDIAGLTANRDYIAHVHSGTCGEGGGEHFKFDAVGEDQPPNEIHLMFRTNANGAATAEAHADREAGPTARSIVVHPMDAMSDKVVCAEFR